MTAAERAHLRNLIVRTRLADQLQAEHADRLLRQAMWPKRRTWTGRCGYCGRRCVGRTCAGHRDLPQLEATIR